MSTLNEAQLLLVARARLDALRHRPYYAEMLFALQPIPSPGLGTLAVDRAANLYIDFEVFVTWPESWRAGALVHEVSHLLHDHRRRAERFGPQLDVTKWNVAADAEINDGLGLPLPEGVVTPEAIGLEPDRLAEHYYRNLPSNPVSPQPNCGSCVDGMRRSWETAAGRGVPSTEIDSIRRRVAEAIRAAPPGTAAAGDRRWATALGRSEIDWRFALRHALGGGGRAAGATHWTYARPSRRRRPGDGPLTPTVCTPAKTIAVVIDTSASMSQQKLDRVGGEVAAICRSLPGAVVHLVSCDTDATCEGTVRSGHRLRLTGGGGTDVSIGIDAALGLRPPPTMIVVATDGYTPWPATRPRRTRVIALLLGATPPSPPGWIQTITVE